MMSGIGSPPVCQSDCHASHRPAPSHSQSPERTRPCIDESHRARQLPQSCRSPICAQTARCHNSRKVTMLAVQAAPHRTVQAHALYRSSGADMFRQPVPLDSGVAYVACGASMVIQVDLACPGRVVCEQLVGERRGLLSQTRALHVSDDQSPHASQIPDPIFYRVGGRHTCQPSSNAGDQKTRLQGARSRFHRLASSPSVARKAVTSSIRAIR